jgi:hypothetical protein
MDFLGEDSDISAGGVYIDMFSTPLLLAPRRRGCSEVPAPLVFSPPPSSCTDGTYPAPYRLWRSGQVQEGHLASRKSWGGAISSDDVFSMTVAPCLISNTNKLLLTVARSM